MRILSLALLLVFSLATDCISQSTPKSPQDATLIHRIEVMVRDKYSVPSNVAVAIGTQTPSQFNGYRNLPVVLSYGGKSQRVDFLLSTDDTKLVRMESFDLLADPVFHIDIAGRPIRGNPDARVTVVNFDDLECPYCAELYKELFPSTFERYGNQVRFVYKYFPLGQHPWATHAAVDAQCLAAQNGGTYWNYVDYLHRHLDQIPRADPDSKKSFAELDRIAHDEGAVTSLNKPELDACIAKQDDSAVRASMAEATALGIHQVPTLYVNGERIDGALPKSEIWAVIDRALKAEGATLSSSPARGAQH